MVTVSEGDGARGMTANSFASISLNPPLVSVSIDKCNRTHDLVKLCDHFVINVLSNQQSAISARYAGCEGELHTKFDDIPHHLTRGGVPMLEGALAHFVCRLSAVHEAGDHTLFIGQVEELTYRADANPLPLIFYSGSYQGIHPAAALPDYIEPREC